MKHQPLGWFALRRAKPPCLPCCMSLSGAAVPPPALWLSDMPTDHTPWCRAAPCPRSWAPRGHLAWSLSASSPCGACLRSAPPPTAPCRNLLLGLCPRSDSHPPLTAPACSHLCRYALNVGFNLQNKMIFNYFPYPWFVSTVHVTVGAIYCGIVYLLGAKKASFEKVRPSLWVWGCWGGAAQQTATCLHCSGWALAPPSPHQKCFAAAGTCMQFHPLAWRYPTIPLPLLLPPFCP